MQIRSYQAADLKTAIQLLKDDLGSDAIILDTRTIQNGENPGQTLAEVIAAVDYDDELDIVRDESLQQQAVNKHEQDVAKPETQLVQDIIERSLTPLRREILALNRRIDSLEQQLVLAQKKGKNDLYQSNDELEEQEVAMLMTQSKSFVDSEELATLAEIPPQEESAVVEDLKKILLGEGLSSEQVSALMDRVVGKLTTRQIVDESSVNDCLITTLCDEIRIAPPIHEVGHTPSIVAFVGPSGKGKTTTIAKMVTELILTHCLEVKLVTLEQEDSLGNELLSSYSRLLDIPILFASDINELGGIIFDSSETDVILIDCAGPDRNDQKALKKLRHGLAALPNIRTELVLSVTDSQEELQGTVEIYREFNVDNLIFTKIDEASSIGNMLTLHFKTKKPLSYLTTGQRVPEDLEIASTERILAQLFPPSFWVGTHRDTRSA